MTQTTDIEIRDLILGLDTKIDSLAAHVDAIAADVVEIKIAQARTDERFNAIDQWFTALETDISDIKTQLRGQDARLWGFVVALFLSLGGVLAKVVFFPQA